MKKIYTFLLMILCFGAGSLNAQLITAAKANTTLKSHPHSQLQRSVSATNDTHIILGSASTDSPIGGLASAYEIKWGSQFSTSYLSLYRSGTIDTIYVAISSGLSNTKLVIANNNTSTPFYEKTVTLTADKWTKIILDSTLTIDASSSLFIGFEGTMAASSYPLYVDASSSINGNSWLGIKSSGVYSFTDYASDFGNLSLYAIVRGDNFPQYNVSLDNVTIPEYAKPTSTFAVPGKITNLGLQDVSQFELEYSLNGTPIDTITITPSAVITNKDSYTFLITNMKIEQEGNHQIAFSVVSINGYEDEYKANNTYTSRISINSKYQDRRIVVEEGTGTWCGWCPRGAVAMANMKSTYPDTFIGIAIHSSYSSTQGIDPMNLTNYINQLGFTSFPMAYVNRKHLIDPGDAKTYYSLESLYSFMGIDINSVNLNSSQDSIFINTELKTAYDSLGVNQRIDFVVIENDVKGTTSGYAQSNNYSGGNYGVMGGYENLPKTVPASQMVYQDVARSIVTGIPASTIVSTSFLAIQPVNFTYKLKLPTNILNKSNIEIVALLIDIPTGKIINASKLAYSDFTSGLFAPVSYSNLSAYAVERNIFINGSFDSAKLIDLTGKTVCEIFTKGYLEAPDAGIYIVKAIKENNTSTTKVIVK